MSNLPRADRETKEVEVEVPTSSRDQVERPEKGVDLSVVLQGACAADEARLIVARRV